MRTRVPAGGVSFAYSDLATLLLSLGELLAGIGLLTYLVRSPAEPRPLTWLRKLHTGSVNDYAAMAMAGMALSALVIAI
jgi:multicomponent Na+:H+ antiporter subunit D